MSAPASVEIARFIRTKGTKLGYRNADDKAKPEMMYSLKDRILLRANDMRILGQNRFEVSMAGAAYNQAIMSDLFNGMLRIRKLGGITNCLLSNNQATAWILTTCYYCSFFAVIELLRCSGKFVSYFARGQTETIIQLATPPIAGTLESGTYEGTANYDSVSDMITISFAKKNIKHHLFAWHEMRQIVAQTRRTLVGVEAIVQERLEQFIGSESNPTWPTPSDVRNHWNYEDATLFGEKGESVGQEFRKLANIQSSVIKWSATRKIYENHQNQAAAIAFVKDVLVKAAENVKDSFLPDSLIRRLPQ